MKIFINTCLSEITGRQVIILLTLILVFWGCGKKTEIVLKDEKSTSTSFSWKDDVQISDLPEAGIKGVLNGREVVFESVTFEKWHGSNEFVLNFSIKKPEQPCGFVEKYEGFQLTGKDESKFKEFVKSKFTDNDNGFSAFFKFIKPEGVSVKSDAAWNSVIKLETVTDKAVKGYIILCFLDPGKSWIAGKFEAKVCNN